MVQSPRFRRLACLLLMVSAATPLAAYGPSSTWATPATGKLQESASPSQLPSASASLTPPPKLDLPDWTPCFRGIEIMRFTTSIPRLARGIAVRIDLHCPGIRFLVTPPKGAKLHEVMGLKTTTFLEKYQCQLVVNGSAFSPKATHEGQTQRVYGLAVSDGRVYSLPTRTGHSALVITRDNHARIARPPLETAGIFNAVSGQGDLLRDGGVVATGQGVEPRTAAGVSRDGRYLVLLVVDGRQPDFSEGCTLPEAAFWLKQLGCWDAINLDGGGTTSMAMADAQGKAKLLNQPIDSFLPGRQRIAGSHLGVYALPLDARLPQ